MLLSEYLSDLTNIIDEYSKTDLIIDSNLSTDFRTEKIGIVKGAITFSDDSMLFLQNILTSDIKLKNSTIPFTIRNRMRH